MPRSRLSATSSNLDGAGRATPYQSTSEVHDVARRFAGANGRVYETTVQRAAAAGVGHISRVELVGLLKGKGKGAAKWHSAYEVMLARRYVEEAAEHLLDYRGLADRETAAAAADAAFGEE